MSKFVLAVLVTVLGVTAASAQSSLDSRGSSRARVIAATELNDNRAPGALSDSTNKPVLKNVTTKSSETVLNHSVTTAAQKNRPRTNATTNGAVAALPLPDNQIYRIGVGDVLDVRLADMPTGKSSLFTVLDGGMLDYPLSSAPVVVAGLTTDEIAERLSSRIKVLDNPRVVVKVRDYSSHNVIVTGFVFDPGARSLRREATPLYVILAEAQPRPEAMSAVILRSGAAPIKIDLKDQNSIAALVMSGDVVKVSGPPAEPLAFFFTGGALNSPGQKTFHKGLTLSQAILASGGVTRTAGNKVSVSRQGADGRLVTTEYNLRQVQEGKTPDPVLQPGDRISVGEGR